MEHSLGQTTCWTIKHTSVKIEIEIIQWVISNYNKRESEITESKKFRRLISMWTLNGKLPNNLWIKRKPQILSESVLT